MEFSEYQEKSRVTAKYPDAGDTFMYPALGLAGETGEIADKLKKLMRDEEIFAPSQSTNVHKEILAKELGDVLWYVSQLATEFDLSLNVIAEKNIEKLYSRLERGVLGGSGDDR